MQAGDWHYTPSAEPNVIPMIDILLVLIIIFMVNVGARRTFDLRLPQETKNVEAGDEQIVLEVLPEDRFFINTQPVTLGALDDRLRSIYAGRPTKILFVKGDPRGHLSRGDVGDRCGARRRCGGDWHSAQNDRMNRARCANKQRAGKTNERE